MIPVSQIFYKCFLRAKDLHEQKLPDTYLHYSVQEFTVPKDEQIAGLMRKSLVPSDGIVHSSVSQVR